MSNSRRVLARQWQIIQYLNAHPRGVRASRLEEVTERSRATVYRDLQLLRDGGIPIETEAINGEVRHRLLRPVELPHLNLTPLQVCALQLARTELSPLAGTGLVRELDDLLSRLRPANPQQSFSFAERPRTERSNSERTSVVRRIEQAMHTRRRARIEYRASSRGGKGAIVHIEPLLVHLARGAAYVRAYCLERGGERLYKLARIAAIEVLDDPCTHMPTQPVWSGFERSVKVWRGDVVRVEVRLDPEVAWLAAEYPLMQDQEVQPGADGSVVVKADVSGTIEAMRWVLSWGGAAEALSPPELREATHRELENGAAKYRSPGVARVSRRHTATGRSRVSRAS